MEKTNKMEGGEEGRFKNRMASPKVESKVLPDTPQISLGFSIEKNITD